MQRFIKTSVIVLCVYVHDEYIGGDPAELVDMIKTYCRHQGKYNAECSACGDEKCQCPSLSNISGVHLRDIHNMSV